MNKTWSVVIPTIREESFKKFMSAWAPLFKKHDVDLFVVFDGLTDSPEYKKLNESMIIFCTDFRIFSSCQDTINSELGNDSWVIPRRTDCIRSYGFYKAYQENNKYTLTLDDDVLPIEGFDVFEEYEKVFEAGMPVSNYYNVGQLIEPQGLFMRGFPFQDRQPKTVMLQYGMWAGVPDLDGMTQMTHPNVQAKVLARVEPIPKGTAVTGCIMNCAFRREFTPNFYQLLMGKDWPFDRWGDIWSGLIAKRICDDNNWAVVINGFASVQHTRASDTNTNIKKESSGYMINEEMWDNIVCTMGCDYESIVSNLCRDQAFYNTEYQEKLSEAARIWTKLFQK